MSDPMPTEEVLRRIKAYLDRQDARHRMEREAERREAIRRAEVKRIAADPTLRFERDNMRRGWHAFNSDGIAGFVGDADVRRGLIAHPERDEAA